MGISIFPSTAAEFVSNNFVIDMNDTTNNTADTGGVKQAGPYSMSFSSGDSSFDVYLIDEDGNSVGYSNSTSITASGLFSSVVILGVANDEIITFNYSGSVNNADGEGDEPGAGAYLESISPSDLPSIDDTATVTGGNFGADTEIFFDSGATSLAAKNITVSNLTELIVTRPDGLIEDDSPYTLRAVTTGVPEPTGTNANLLVDAVTAGSDPTWVTTSPLNPGVKDVAFSQTLEASDTDGTVVDYSVTAGTLTTGLSLNSSTGVLSGTPTTTGNFTFTVTATDDGGNTTSREFEQLVSFGASGGQEFQDGGFNYHLFTSTDDLEVQASSLSVDYLVIAGGGRFDASDAGGGAGGLLQASTTLTPGTITCTVGAGGSLDGSDSQLGGIVTAIGGGGGGATRDPGRPGGSGGGAGRQIDGDVELGGAGTAGQGNDGGKATGDNSVAEVAGGGGGAGAAGTDGHGFGDGSGGDGLQFSDWATATGTGVDSGYYAGGGGGAQISPDIAASAGLGTGAANTGGGGSADPADVRTSVNGHSGIVIVRYAI